MKIETERKFRVSSFTEVRKKLRALGAKCEAKGVEINWMLKLSGRLRKARASLRVRRSDTGHLTFKDPFPQQGVKRAREYEVAVGNSVANIDELVKIFGLLGFPVRFKYRKRREYWQLGHVLITLDTPPKIGKFVEVEAVKRADVFRIAQKLGLSFFRSTTKSYPGLLKEAGYKGEKR